MHIPWFLALGCIDHREKQLKRNHNKLAMLRSAETSNILPNHSMNIRRKTDREMQHQKTSAIIEQTEDSNLPDYLEITPAVVIFTTGTKQEYIVTVMNLSDKTVCVPPKAIVPEKQPAMIVF